MDILYEKLIHCMHNLTKIFLRLFFIFFKKDLCSFRRNHIFAVASKKLKQKFIFRAISSVGSEHLVYTEGVGGSNPSAPTLIIRHLRYNL